MPRLRLLLRHINLLNLLLAAVMGYLVIGVVLPFFNGGVAYTVPSLKKPAISAGAEQPKPAEARVPSPADYLVIGDQNLFHPERKIPVPPPAKVEAPPLPTPDFVLYGTLETADLAVAFMEDKKAPKMTQGRGKRIITLKLGDSLSGFVLKEIDKDRVVMVRGEEKMVVSLNDRVKDRDVPALPAAAGFQPHPLATGHPAPQPPQAAPFTLQHTETPPVTAPPATSRPIRRGLFGNQ